MLAGAGLGGTSEVIFILLTLMVAPTVAPASFSPGQQAAICQQGADIYATYSLRGSAAVSAAIPSTNKQNILASFGDLACSTWQGDLAAKIPSASERQTAERMHIELRFSQLLSSFIQAPTNVDSVSELKKAYAYTVKVCEERTSGGMRELAPLTSAAQLTEGGAAEEADDCPNANTCEACTNSHKCVWCGGSKASTQFCKRGSIHGPADSTAKRLTPFKRPAVTDAESCELTYQYGFCAVPGGCPAIKSCAKCVESPLCVFCISSGRCDFGNRQQVHDSNVCSAHVSKFKNPEACPAPGSSKPNPDSGPKSTGAQLTQMVDGMTQAQLNAKFKPAH